MFKLPEVATVMLVMLIVIPSDGTMRATNNKLHHDEQEFGHTPTVLLCVSFPHSAIYHFLIWFLSGENHRELVWPMAGAHLSQNSNSERPKEHTCLKHHIRNW